MYAVEIGMIANRKEKFVNVKNILIACMIGVLVKHSSDGAYDEIAVSKDIGTWVANCGE